MSLDPSSHVVTSGKILDKNRLKKSEFVYEITLKYLPNLCESKFIFQGSTSHKFVDASGNPIMRMYYTSRPVLFCMCAGNELFYAALYLLNFTSGPFYMFNISKFLLFIILKRVFRLKRF